MAENIIDIIRSNVSTDSEDAFFVFSVEDIIAKHHKWVKEFPQVVPHYAVKCNNNPLVLEILVGLGLSFDCSSQVWINCL